MINLAPNCRVRLEPGQTTRSPIASRWDQNDHNEEGYDVERAAGAIDASDPFGWERRHAAVYYHNETSQEESLVVCWDVVRILDCAAG